MREEHKKAKDGLRILIMGLLIHKEGFGYLLMLKPHLQSLLEMGFGSVLSMAMIVVNLNVFVRYRLVLNLVGLALHPMVRRFFLRFSTRVKVLHGHNLLLVGLILDQIVLLDQQL
jgi:hypothetical protein